jgi:hypothetical protein
MSRPDADLPGRRTLSERDLVIAELVGRYIEHREHGHAGCAQDLLAVAAEHGDIAVCALQTLLACYEAMRASEPAAGRRADPPAKHGTPARDRRR